MKAEKDSVAPAAGSALHTPGPWWANPETGAVEDANGFAIWSTPADDDPEGWANAKLIAAAPDMADMLQMALALLGGKLDARTQIAAVLREAGVPARVASLPEGQPQKPQESELKP